MPLLAAHEYPIWINGLIFLAAAGIVWLAGTRLVGYLDQIAAQTGLGQAFIGMLLLGGITSLPEIANVITSSWMGNPALAINNLLGSASINVLLLAIVDAVIGRDALTSVVSGPATLMQATLCMLVLALVAIAITSGDVALFGVGIWSILLFTVSLAAFWISARYEHHTAWQPKTRHRRRENARGQRGSGDGHQDSLARLTAKTATAAALIFAAGYCLSQTGDALAVQTGLGASLVGFVLIGLATSLPELSTITAALRMRKYEMAIAEVFGTNFVNISLILLADLVFAGGPVINEIGRFEIVSALLGVLLTGVILVGLLERRNLTILRMGYDSLGVIVIFAAGLLLLFGIR